MTITSEPNRVFLNGTEPNSFRTQSVFAKNRTETELKFKKSIPHISN